MWWTVVAVMAGTYLLLDRLIRLVKVADYGQKFVLVTGCDSGFGRELAIRLDKMGFPVFAACLTEEGRRGLAETCSSRLVTLTLNVADHDNIREAFQFVKQKLPNEKSLWAVVNNAGVGGCCGAAETCFHQDYVSACNVNLFGPIEVSRVFMPLLRRSRGRLVVMTSITGRLRFSGGPYSVSKCGLEAFGDIVRLEFARFGVKVSLIEPGFFRTDITNVDRLISSLKKGYNKADPEVQEALGKNYIQWYSDLVMKSKDVCSLDTYKVVDAYVAAITSAYPRARYVVGNDARFFLVPLSFMPEWISDWAINRMIGHPNN